jgi:outer membrane protein assembly factor BamB
VAANYKTGAEGYGAIRAIDPKTGEKKWDFKMVNNTECGVLSTASDLARIIREGGRSEGQLCYKHVV